MEVDPDLLRQHVAQLTRVPRPAESAPLEEARLYVTECLRASGWIVVRDTFEAETEAGSVLLGINLLASHEQHRLGGGPRLCVGAHLDSRPETPGADDNASGVAALLEIARLLPQAWPDAPRMELELVVFDLEEDGMLGGTRHAQRHRAQQTDLRGMISLEMLGYCDERPRSQALPRPLVGLYPDVGNFIALIGNQNSNALLEAFRTGMQRVPELPVETLSVPDNGNVLQATRLSDHSPFWDAGFAALMITDTSFLRNPHYHFPSDTLETLDLVFLQKVTQGCLEAVRHTLRTGL
jgi:hypothetical protein